MGATVLTQVLANSPWGTTINHFWEKPAFAGLGAFHLELTLKEWVNEGLMTLFFLLVGLELKREIIVGELSSIRDAALPMIAALGGMQFLKSK